MIGGLMKKIIREVDDVEEKNIRQADFFLSQIINALSPTNFILTNPQVLQEIMATNGNNLVQGLENMLQDIEKTRKGLIDIQTNDQDAFTIGLNIATSIGKVIYQNELIQLIHYSPIVAKNFAIPLLIVPPFINKFYILDLNPDQSCIRWLLMQGYNVFVISCINPGKELAQQGFEDYVLKGPVAALEAISTALAVKKN